MSAIVSEVKNIFEMNREELLEYNKSKLMEFKELFLTTDLSVDEIYKKIGVSKNDSTYRYINGSRKTHGLTAKNRKVNFNIVEETPEEEEKRFEENYQKFKEVWVNNPTINKKDAFNQIGLTYHGHSKLNKYILKRMKEDKLPSNHQGNYTKTILYGAEKQTRKRKKKAPDKDFEEEYQKFKDMFENTDLSMKEIYKSFGIPYVNPQGNELGRYITKRKKEDKLNGHARAWRIKNKDKPKKPKKKKEKTKKATYTVTKQSQYSEKAHKMLENSRDTLCKMYSERNISKSTQNGYEAAFVKYCEFTKDRFDNLQDMLDFYLAEEDKRIPMRERSLKKDLLEFREYLLNRTDFNQVKSDKSFKTYFAKVKTIFNHFELEMPTLPQMKLQKGYVSSYNDLPTHDMIKTACEQSPLDLKALILFMSSSGSAKAETLSITIEMFLEGCNEYLEIPANSKNIPETIKALSDRHDIVPMIYLRRIKTDKWYYTYCSPEASYMIIEAMKTRKNLKWSDKLFDYTGILVLSRFQEINDNNNWGNVGSYRRFRSHALRKFMASNIGLPRDITDSIQGRSKDEIQEAYFKQDPKSLKKTYMEVMHRVMVYENWGHGTTLAEIERQKKRLFNDFKDDEKIIDLSVIPETPEEIKTSIGLETDTESTVTADKSSHGIKHNNSNSMPVSAPQVLPVGHVNGISVSKELLNYAELMEKGLLSIAEFNRVKQKLLMSVLR